MIGKTARVTLSGPKKLVSIWGPELCGADLLEVSGVVVAGVVDEHIDASEPFDGRLCSRVRCVGVGDVQGDCEQLVVLTDGVAPPALVASGGHDRVSGCECRLGDVHAHPPTGAGDEPPPFCLTFLRFPSCPFHAVMPSQGVFAGSRECRVIGVKPVTPTSTADVLGSKA